VRGIIIRERTSQLAFLFDALPKVLPTNLPREPYPGTIGVAGRVFLNTDTT